jgi:hypothetical protein
MADRFPVDTHKSSINLNSTRQPRGKDFSLMLKSKAKRTPTKNSKRKAKCGLSAASSALSSAQLIPKKQSTVRPLTRASAKLKGGKIQRRHGDDDDESPPSPPPDTVRPLTHASAKKKGGKIHSGRGGQRKRPPELLGETMTADVQSSDDDAPNGLRHPYKSAYLEQQGKCWKIARLHSLIQELALHPSRIAKGDDINQRKSPHELLGETGTTDEQGGERISKEYQMVGVDAQVEYSMAALPPMEDEEGENKKNDPPEVVGVNTQDDEGDSQLKDPHELLRETGTADEQGGERILKEYQMVGVEAHVPYSMAPPPGIIRRREMLSQNIIVVVWSCSMGRESGGNLYNSRRMYPTSNLIQRQQDARVLFTALTPWFGVS